MQLEVHVRSPSVKIHRAANYDIRSLPVFGEQDKVSGQVLLDVSLCVTPGRLTIFVRIPDRSILFLFSDTITPDDIDSCQAASCTPPPTCPHETSRLGIGALIASYLPLFIVGPAKTSVPLP